MRRRALLLLDGYGKRREKLDSHRRTCSHRDLLAIAGLDDCRAAARAGCCPDGRSLGAAEDRAENRAADRPAADFRGAAVGGRLALAINGFRPRARSS